jgi:hypothetical protein
VQSTGTGQLTALLQGLLVKKPNILLSNPIISQFLVVFKNVQRN